jgi:hypothetical protein
MRTYIEALFHSQHVLTQTEQSQQLAQEYTRFGKIWFQDLEKAHPQIIESSNLDSAVERSEIKSFIEPFTRQPISSSTSRQ